MSEQNVNNQTESVRLTAPTDGRWSPEAIEKIRQLPSSPDGRPHLLVAQYEPGAESWQLVVRPAATVPRTPEFPRPYRRDLGAELFRRRTVSPLCRPVFRNGTRRRCPSRVRRGVRRARSPGRLADDPEPEPESDPAPSASSYGGGR